MLEDKWLVWKFKAGSGDALRRIYEKYKNDLLALAIALSNNKSVAEDIVHNVFVSFAQSAGKLQLRGSLKSYLSTAVANNARNLKRDNARLTSDANTTEVADSILNQPDRLAISIEDSQCVGNALQQLPYQQREVIILHLQGGLKFGEIARSQSISVNTVQSRYRYGLNKMRSILDGEVKK
jgi:RNA polymerase sigma-70 factor (ECF subfamily)